MTLKELYAQKDRLSWEAFTAQSAYEGQLNAILKAVALINVQPHKLDHIKGQVDRYTRKLRVKAEGLLAQLEKVETEIARKKRARRDMQMARKKTYKPFAGLQAHSAE